MQRSEVHQKQLNEKLLWRFGHMVRVKATQDQTNTLKIN